MHASPLTTALSRRLGAGVVTVALAAGGLVVTAPASLAAPTGAAVSAETRADTAACQKARKKVSKAKKNLRTAKRAKVDRAAKVRRAKVRLQAAKERKAQACAPATEETVLEQVSAGQLSLDALDLNGLTAQLPPELAAALEALVAQLQAALDEIGAGVPGADTAQLEALLAALQAMDVQGVVTALQDLLGQLTAVGGGPDAMAALIALLQGGLPGGGTLPIEGAGDLETLLASLQAHLGGLGGFDWTTAPAQLQAAFAQVVALLESLSGELGGSAPDLDVLMDLIDQLSDLGSIDLSDVGASDDIAAILQGILGQLGGGDPLAQLQQLLSSGGLAGILALLEDLLGGILGGILGRTA
jgi:hypothetical protein